MASSVCFYGWDFQIERSAIRCDRDGASKRWLLLFDTSGCRLVWSRDREIEMWSWAVRSRVAIAADSHHGARPAHNAQATIKLLRTTLQRYTKIHQGPLNVLTKWRKHNCKGKNRHKSKHRHKHRQEHSYTNKKNIWRMKLRLILLWLQAEDFHKI